MIPITHEEAFLRSFMATASYWLRVSKLHELRIDCQRRCCLAGKYRPGLASKRWLLTPEIPLVTLLRECGFTESIRLFREDSSLDLSLEEACEEVRTSSEKIILSAVPGRLAAVASGSSKRHLIVLENPMFDPQAKTLRRTQKICSCHHDEAKICTLCGRDFVFTASEAHLWEHSLNIDRWITPKNCLTCRRQLRQEKEDFARLSEAGDSLDKLRLLLTLYEGRRLRSVKHLHAGLAMAKRLEEKGEDVQALRQQLKGYLTER